jgi:hypothetical protein
MSRGKRKNRDQAAWKERSASNVAIRISLRHFPFALRAAMVLSVGDAASYLVLPLFVPQREAWGPKVEGA